MHGGHYRLKVPQHSTTFVTHASSSAVSVSLLCSLGREGEDDVFCPLLPVLSNASLRNQVQKKKKIII